MTKATIIYLAALSIFTAALVMGCQPAARDVRVAAISFVPEKFNPEANVEQLEKRFRQAAEQGAQIAVAPEGAIEGYVIEEVINGDAPLHRLVDVAITLDDPIIQRFQNLARELNMCLAFGFAQRKGDDIYNSAVFIDNKGKICGNYHKVDGLEFEHVPAERLKAESEKYGRDYPSKWYNRPGEDNPAFDTPFGRGGFMICADRWNPDLARKQALDGATFLMIPAYGSRGEDQDKAVLSRARENGIPVVEANVGVTIIISEDQFVKVSRKEDVITIDTISIPPQPSIKDRDKD